MIPERLNGFCMLGIHRKYVKSTQEDFEVKVLSRFQENVVFQIIDTIYRWFAY